MFSKEEWLEVWLTANQWLRSSRKDVKELGICGLELIAEWVQLVELCSAHLSPLRQSDTPNTRKSCV